MLAAGLAARAGILLAHMVDAFEATRKVFDLPALLGTYFFALDATAGTGALLGAQLVHARGDREIFEIRQMAPPTAPLHPPQIFFLFCMRRNILMIERLGE